MSRIRIKYFGPIKNGLEENGGWIEIRSVIAFIGNQGSAKSSIAKLISTLTWIEKAMVLGVLRQDELSIYKRFIKQLEYQRLTNYITKETAFEYQGKAFTFKFVNGDFTVKKSVENGYVLPKIMYVPAERNILSVAQRPDKLRGLPAPLYTFLEEYDQASAHFASGLELPINKANFFYDKLNRISHIVVAIIHIP